MRSLILYILILLLCTMGASAQQNDIYTSYGVDDGLPQSSVWSVAQDKKGFMWVGTSDGFCRFDGYKFTTYNDMDITSGGLYVKFFRDSNEDLWFVTQGGIGYYDAVHDKFATVFRYKTTYHNNYNCILGESRESIWSIICGYGILKIDKATHKITNITNDDIRSIKSCPNAIKCDNEIWMTGSHTGCTIYNTTQNTIETLPVPRITSIAALNDSQLVAATNRSVIVFNKKSHAYNIVPVAYDDSTRTYITSIVFADTNTAMFGDPRGIFYLDPHTWKITRHVAYFDDASRTPFSYVQCLYKDNSGNIWIGTNGDGLKKLSAPYKKFKFYPSLYSKSHLVKSIYCDPQKLYVGYYASGIDVFDRKNGLLRSVKLDNTAMKPGAVLAITATDTASLIFQTGGISSIATLTSAGGVKDVTRIFKNVMPNDIQTGYPFFLHISDSIYTNSGQHTIVSFRQGPGILQPVARYVLDSELITCGFKSSDGTLWIGTAIGIWKAKADHLEKVSIGDTAYVKSVAEDKEGNIWLGTLKGIYVLGRDNHVLKHYTRSNGLSNQFIYGILRDDKGDMWFSHNKGISVFHAATRSFRHYVKEDGLQSDEFNTGAYFKAIDGELFFGGINGVNSFFPADIKDNPHAPVTVITGIKLFDLPLTSDTAYWNIHSLTLPYTQNTLSFEFSALEYTDPLRNQYAYMMEGIDNSWISAGDKRFARYAALPAGTYTFYVKAANSDGLWQQRPTALTIHIIPPYWQRAWFRLLVLLGLLGGTTGLIIWWQRQQHRRQLRAMELQQKIQLERERISRDLHDTVGTQLSLISNNIEWLAHPLKKMDEAEKTSKLHFVNNTAKEVIAAFRETIWALNSQRITYEEFSDKLKGFVRKQLTSYPQIQLRNADPVNRDIILGPSEALNLFRICQEAIANALKYSGAGIIEIRLDNSGDKFRVMIIDDGCGFDPGIVDAAQHNGLENIRYRAQDIDCDVELISSAGKGTTIIINKK